MKILKYVVFLWIWVSIQNCTAPSPPAYAPEFQNSLDEILHNAMLDGDFTTCNPDAGIFQYFNDSKGLKIEGEEKAIDDHFEAGYKAPANSKESGLVRIRFVVNCKGESGRFRLLAMDDSYQQKVFDTAITDQLMALTKSLKGWGKMTWQEVPKDYYQYLIFKIEKGAITKILP